MNDTRWQRKVLEWIPPGKLKRGKQRRSWKGGGSRR